MLKQLTVKNYALIKELEFVPAQGLNVITGETGAGKSILLGALGLVLGQRADHSALFDEKEKCIIEARFDIGKLNLESFFKTHELDFESVTIVRREISPGGKSRSFINDTPVSLNQLKELGEQLVEIQTQSSGILITNPIKQFELIDGYARNSQVFEKYSVAYSSHQSLYKQLLALKELAAAQNKERDYLQFQFNELASLDIKIGEEEALEKEIDLLTHALDISQVLNTGENLIDNAEIGLVPEINKLRNALKSIQSYFGESANYLKKLEEIRIDLIEMGRDFGRKAETLEQNPEKLNILNERFAKLTSLLKKHGCNSASELMAIQTDLEAKLDLGENLTNQINELENKLVLQLAELKLAAENLSKSRMLVVEQLSLEVTNLLNALEMQDSKLEFQLEQGKDFRENGIDLVKMMFSANTGKPLQQIEKAASGGELSRVLFSTKAILAKQKSLPSLVLDEADTGVSGVVANTMGQVMREMAKNIQIIAITHLPQVAAKGEHHYFVYKETENGKTYSKIRLLDNPSREKAIATMLSGKELTEAAISNARDLLSK